MDVGGLASPGSQLRPPHGCIRAVFIPYVTEHSDSGQSLSFFARGARWGGESIPPVTDSRFLNNSLIATKVSHATE